MVVLTAGLWLLVIPFYPTRCINCGISQGEALRMEVAPSLNRIGSVKISDSPVTGVLISVAVAGLILLALFVAASH